MLRLIVLALILSASSWGVIGCTKTTNAGEPGVGFEMLTPSPETRNFIISNDIPFSKQIVGHNATCRQLAGCVK